MADTPVIYEPRRELPGGTPHAVLIAGDEEYRSEEMLPQLGKILAVHHGFRVTMLFSLDPQTGVIDPNQQRHLPGLEALEEADLMVIFTRFRNLPDESMSRIDAYLQAGKPVVGIRTSTHAFAIDQGSYRHYSWNHTGEKWPQGFGREILGETWINHHGQHGRQGTRGRPVAGQEGHPILRGVDPYWAPTDVYGVRLPLPGDAQPLVEGLVLTGMKSTDPPVTGELNDPSMPIAWTKTYAASGGRRGRAFTSTAGASQDFADANLRRLLVNACYWGLGREADIDPERSVDLVGEYRPSPFAFGGFRKGIRPEDHRLRESLPR